MRAWTLLCTFLASLVAATVAVAAPVDNGYLQGPGGYYNQADRSGPYSIGPNGTSYLLGVPGGGTAALPPQAVIMTVTNNAITGNAAAVTPLQSNNNRKYLNIFNSTGGACRYAYGTGTNPAAPTSSSGMPLSAATGFILESSAITYQSISFWCASTGTIDITEGQ